MLDLRLQLNQQQQKKKLKKAIQPVDQMEMSQQ
jgi:hypothetical protein